MLLGFSHFWKLVLFIISFCFSFFKKQNIDFKKASWPEFCNIIFLFLLKIGSVGPVDQQINLASPS